MLIEGGLGSGRVGGDQLSGQSVALVIASGAGVMDGEAISTDEGLKLAAGPFPDVGRVPGLAEAVSAGAAFAGWRGQDDWCVVARRGEGEHHAHGDVGVDQVLEDIGADDDGAVQLRAGNGQGSAGLEVAFDPVAEGMVCPAPFDVRPVIYADVMPFLLVMLQERELPCTTAADVDDHVASELPGKARSVRVDIRLPCDAVIGRVGEVIGGKALLIGRRQTEPLGSVRLPCSTGLFMTPSFAVVG